MIKTTSKANCAGCKALVDNGSTYECKLAYGLAFKTVGVMAVQPSPTEACEKPKTAYKLRKAKDAKGIK